MDRDKIIAVCLVVGFAFLLLATLGIVAITGFVLLNSDFTTSPTLQKDTKSILEQDATSSIIDINVDSTENSTQLEEQEEEPVATPAAVCGNGKKENGEICEANSDCGSNQQCSACKCQDLPPVEKTLLSDIKVEKLTFTCVPDFEGKKGLGVKIIRLKNDSSSDFSATGNGKISATTANTTDTVTTNNAFKFSIKSGKLLDIYGTNTTRTSAQYMVVFLGNQVEPTKLTIDLPDNKYIEYTYDLKANDFSSVGCL
ncbi:MAG TPA: hypothetical protein VJG83_01660 [archaeon]|nr:hypothetical protein [archaeon]